MKVSFTGMVEQQGLDPAYDLGVVWGENEIRH